MVGLAREADRDLKIIGYYEREIFKQFERELGPSGWEIW